MNLASRRLAPLLILVLAAAVAVTLIEGTAGGLPGVALGSTVLLHVERAASLFAVVVALISILEQAARGRLPTHLSTAGLAYGAEDFAGDISDTVTELQRQVDDLKVALLAMGERLEPRERGG